MGVSTRRACDNMSSVKTNGSAVGEVLKSGYLRKQKTMKKKFFVLRAETPDSLARLEYYDDDKKWRKNQNPKRVIVLKTCFNINRNRRHDTKQKHVIDLYTRDDCFSVVFDNEEELEEWLKPMLFLQHGEELWDGEPPKPSFEHVWQVRVMEKGLGAQRKIYGNYRLCLTEKSLSLVPSTNSKLDILEFSLIGIRRCGFYEAFFYIEVGRSSVTGAGDIFMATNDINITRNMHDIILQAMTNSNKEELPPKLRSNSINESSKPSYMNPRRLHIGSLKSIESPGNGSAAGRERCDSLPSRARTTSEGQVPRGGAHHGRPRSMYGHDGPASPPSAYSTDSAGSSLSIDETDWPDTPANEFMPVGRCGHSLTPDEHVIFEENDDWDRPSTMPKNSPNISSGIHSGSPSGASCGSSPHDVNLGYVPMCPGDTGYVDMRLSPAASSCSITSGTPSTDLRFSEYHLDKVSSYIPVEEEETGRPLRTYSIGSKLQRSDLPKVPENTRVRAYSAGSHSRGDNRRKPKASSAPLMAGSPMGDLMEMDFSTNRSSETPNGYVEMRPLSQSSSTHSEYVDMKPGSITKDSPYVDMSGSQGTSPMKSMSNHHGPYVDMSGFKSGTSPKTTKSSSPKQESGYMLMTAGCQKLSVESKKNSEGYVEMTRRTQRKSNTSTGSNASDDYLNMNCGRSNEKRKEQRREKTRSKPIAIQSKPGTPPKTGPPSYLPLRNASNSSPTASPFSSLRREKSRKTPETPTPTGSVFPFSMSSPGFQTPDGSRKIPVDATSGTVRISCSNSFENNTTVGDYPPISFQKPANDSSMIDPSRQRNEDYAEVGFGCEDRPAVRKETSDYMNYDPACSRSVPTTKPISKTDDYGEYAIMKPVSSMRRITPIRKTSLPFFPTAQIPSVLLKSPCSPHQVQIVKPGVNMTNLPQSSFKPIVANLPKLDDDNPKPKSISPKTVDNLLTRQLSNVSIDKKQDCFAKSSESLSTKTTDSRTLNVRADPTTRPNSVNGDKISTRPASVNSDKFSVRPSSVSSEGSLCGSRPSSSSSDLNSSSSTLVGSRPPSVSSDRELHYISLDHDESGSKSPRGPKVPNSATVADSSAGSPSPALNAQSEPKFTYSSIDFNAMDELKQNNPNAPLPQNTKIKH